MGMLRSSVRRSSGVYGPMNYIHYSLNANIQQAGVTKSCTVRLNDEIYCVRDDGEWTDCPSGAGVNDLVIAVEKLYRSS